MSVPGAFDREGLGQSIIEIKAASDKITKDSRRQNPEQKGDRGLQTLPPTDVPYSIFTKPQKLFICLLASFAGMFSTLCSYIYYPALVPIARDLSVSVSLINLTITSYLIIAAVAPAFMGDMADQSGRRPVYILMFVLFIAANMGIALQKSFAALLVLRMLQSAGSSGLIAIAYGVIADITTREERGGFVGIFDLLINFAVSMGPVIGGSITQQLGWRWIFWFLVILTTTQFVLMLLFFPETQRKIVGNGSVKPRRIYWSLFSLFHVDRLRDEPTIINKPKRHWPNPFACLPVLASKESLVVILLYSITYCVKMVLQASLGAQCVEIYKLSYLNAGLIYLPSGVAGGLGSLLTGKLLDRTYRLTVARNLVDQSPEAGVLPEIHIANLRLKGSYVVITISALGTLGYGLALMKRTSIAVMIVMQFITGLTTACIFTMTGTLLTDLNRNRSATAQGACSLVRCLLAAAGVAAVQPLANIAGLGWCFAIYAMVLLLELPLIWIVRTRKPR